MNQIIAIHPYYSEGLWVFDDESVGLIKEPFVSGMPEIIELFIKEKEIQNAKNGFTILFSAQKFPDSDITLSLVESEYGGNWYEIDGFKGWLCPALFKYFNVTPINIYIKLLNK